MKPFIIAIAGGTAGGKSTCARELEHAAAPGEAAVVYLDSYYRDQTPLPLEQRAAANYDHPSAFEFELLGRHLCELSAGRAVEMPIYDFTTHTRAATRAFAPTPLIVVEGILILYPEDLRRFYDLKLFVDAPADLRLERRLERDMRERGRSRESVLRQWRESVYPMHLQYCEPTRTYADRVVSGMGDYAEAIREVLKAARGGS